MMVKSRVFTASEVVFMFEVSMPKSAPTALQSAFPTPLVSLWTKKSVHTGKLLIESPPLIT